MPSIISELAASFAASFFTLLPVRVMPLRQVRKELVATFTLDFH